jgi:hypothetical protein
MPDQYNSKFHLYAGGTYFSSKTGAITLTRSCAVLEDTDMLEDGKTRVPGIGDTSFSADLFCDLSPIDQSAFNLIGVNAPVTIAVNAKTAGSLTYNFDATFSEYNLSGNPNDLLRAQLSAQGDGRLFRGAVLLNDATNITATGSASATVVPYTFSGIQKIQATLHVVSVSGTTPSAIFKIRQGGADVVTFSAATAAGSQIIMTDSLVSNSSSFDVTYTVSGTTPVFNALISLGFLG